ncbi:MULTISPECIES: 2-oxoacid:acceptor oxidoreductase family protein [unclassified Brenneria]|uniref:2-oxoacid:acceptor oxidoreductase family protein n=1 Tax=unclassified Brenneria TaxID=2634434 RepID=UPI0029C574A2|nr:MULTISPECIES: 2-oxoacid:acceptor oxidoreductase family protein [unclassified Brenneria]MDX5627731.1 2-oxoacid:acceptor oxidoreductase family protein [Brenneria sp. L3-3Z]MDX5695178.1 2-oxoacid:acceptor oxidoreductase family protein [Brenneria sp. L4-2C]
MLDILWLGRGGQGAFTAARLLGLGAVRFADLEAMAFPSFGPERRGAPVYAYTRLSRSPIRDRSPVRQAQVAVVMDDTLLPQLRVDQLSAGSLILIDGEHEPRFQPRPHGLEWRVPARALAEHHLGSRHTNTVLLGILNGLLDLLPSSALEQAIISEFAPHRQPSAPLPERARRNLAAFAAAGQFGQAEKNSAAPLTAWLAAHHRPAAIQEAAHG